MRLKTPEPKVNTREAVKPREPRARDHEVNRAHRSSDTLDSRQLLKALRAVKKGEFCVRLPHDQTGIAGDIAEAFNDVVELNQRITAELERLSTVVGKEGKIAQRAALGTVGGSWATCIQSVNALVTDLVQPTAEMARVIGAVAKGDLSQRMALEIEGRQLKGEFNRIGKTVNTMVDQLSSFASEVTRVAREVGTEGKLGGQAQVKGVAGSWKDLTDNVNMMAANLTAQVRNIADVTTAVANGDLSKKITVDVKGEILELKETINTMVDQLNGFASEVTRVAREVGTEGKLGGQAIVKGVAGTWKDLTDTVNMMAANLTAQVRGIAVVVTAVANGNLTRKLTVEAKGEIAALADTINGMMDTLATFADQVTTVAREVGIEGKLGGQARVPGAAGTWRDLTDNVNQLAANLTTQVRAIAEVATAVTKGDLTRSITVVAQGEVAALKDNINEMIRNLKETTQKNTEQHWLKTNLARFTRMLQGQRDLTTVAKMILSELAPLVTAQHGLFYLAEPDEDGASVLKMQGTYAYRERKSLANRSKLGEGLVGQCALEKERILLSAVPPDYIHISSGLGEAPPLNIIVMPVLFEGRVMAVIELASFNRFSDIHQLFLDQLTESIGVVLNTIAANMKTEDLLKQSQSLTAELQIQQEELKNTNERLEQQAASLKESEELLRKQQEELRQTNEELQEKARLLSDQNQQVELKNREVELAKLSLEEKAEQLALSSKYKSEFLANMSHELRTPLNSLLILAKLLSDNDANTLTPKQVEFAKTIYSSGADLLALINDILDLAKIESGTMTVEAEDLSFEDLKEYVERTFRQFAETNNLDFNITTDTVGLDAVRTDSKRLKQVLKNLLSNSFKFTEKGAVTLDVSVATDGWSPDHPVLSKTESVFAFSVADTGIGIPLDKQKVIFEAFQQADGSTSRRYGGTGLGLSISREIARLLGGEIRLTSTPGLGSTFTLFLPMTYQPVLEIQRKRLPAATLRPRPFEPPPHVEVERAEMMVEESVPDDRATIEAGDRTILIVEDDASFARVLVDIAHEKGFKALVAHRGDSGLALAREFEPDGITLDLNLPVVDGWKVLDRLKHDPLTRHTPVHVISVEGNWKRGLKMGAIAYLEKPADRERLGDALARLQTYGDRRMKDLLVVEGDDEQRRNIRELIGNGDVQTSTVATGEEALASLAEHPCDCVVLALSLPDMTGFDLIRRIRGDARARELPIIIYADRELTGEEAAHLKRMSSSAVVKDVCSPEGLLDQTALFLHRVEANLPESKRQVLQQLRDKDPVLKGKKVLIVDDDVRNIFALTSMLEHQDMEVVYAESGKEGIEILQAAPDVDFVLMDVMMPEMDGYETMRAIRGIDALRDIPIIAVTAKAMRGDREKCLDAGASDYITKPVDMSQLMSLLRVWL